MPTSEYQSVLEAQRRAVVAFVKACANESRTNEKDKRRPQNTKNWNYFHGTIDWSHKEEDDPTIHLHKVGVAAERIRAKFKQALMNYDKWITVVREYEQPDAAMTPFAARSLLTKQLRRCDARTKISDAILNGAIESRLTVKVSGKYVPAPKRPKQKLGKNLDTVWQLDLPVLSFEKFHVDTLNANDPLYQIEEFRTDHFRVLDLASEEQSSDKPLRLEAVKELRHFTAREQEEAEKASEGNTLKADQMKERKMNLIQNFCGNVLADDGSIMEWQNEDGKKVPLRNVMCVVGNEEQLLLDPEPIQRWSSKSPYIWADLLRSPGTGRKALLDAGTDINHAENELFSLMLLAGIKTVHGVTWTRPDWISNKEVLSGGLKDGTNLELNSSAPLGQEPIGVCNTGKMPQEAVTMKGMLDSVFAENVISNQIDLSGTLPGKQVRATELVSANNAIGDVFDSFAGDVEDQAIEPLAEEAFFEIIQHIDEMDEDEVKSCWGTNDQDKAEKFLKMSEQERFDECFGAFRFEGRGLHDIIANMAHAQLLVNYLNTMAANPIMMSAVESQISAARIALKLADKMGIDREEIQPDAQERQLIEDKQRIREQALGAAQVAEAQGRPGQGGGPSQSQGAPQGAGMVVGNGQQGF